jgi:multidrug efflux pump subunit AcrA (membrane-fusion protein)
MKEAEIKQSSGSRWGIFFCLFLVLILALIFGIQYYVRNINPCHVPVKYTIGNIDSRFKVSENDVLKMANEAAGRWDSESGKNLLDYNSSATLKINLVYDQRQQELDRLNSEINKLNNQNLTLDEIKKKVESDLASYEQELNSYNSEVDYYNAHGGAPPAKYQELQNEKQRLEGDRQTINQEISLLNNQIDLQNSNIADVKNEVSESQNKIITQGEYNPQKNEIDIYIFGDLDELRLVLMHEFGHALSLNHDASPNSIMYNLLGEQDLKTQF